MTALFNGIVDVVRENHPDVFSFTEKDVPRAATLASLAALDIAESMTEKEYTYSWGWVNHEIAVVIKTTTTASFDSNWTKSFFVKPGALRVFCNQKEVSLPNKEPRLYPVSFNPTDRTKPEGLVPLLEAIQHGTVPAVSSV